MQTVDEFAQKIKTKYPEYSEMDNRELAQKIVNKHPEYKDQVSLEAESSFADKYIGEPIMKAQDAVWKIPVVGNYLKNDAAKDLPYMMPQTALSVPMKSAEPFLNHVVNPIVSRATKPIADHQ